MKVLTPGLVYYLNSKEESHCTGEAFKSDISPKHARPEGVHH